MSKTKKPRCQRQITLHFNEDTKHILELFEQCAKEDMRTVESEILFELNGVAKAIAEERAMIEERAVVNLEKADKPEPAKEAEAADCDMVPQCDEQGVE